MAFPDLVPSSRQFDPGDYPVKKQQMMDGFETRILYGSKRVNAKMQLTYQNISDTDVVKFWDHYEETRGTFETFRIGGTTGGAKAGMTLALATVIPFGSTSDTTGYGYWRYEGPPSVTSVYPGVSTVSVQLLAVIE